MNIEHGLLRGQVLQRDRRGMGSAAISGRARTDGDVEYRILKNGRVVRGGSWTAAGTARNGKFTAHLKALPTGGPYRIELRIRRAGGSAEQAAVSEVFVGDVWILAGQSNMEGLGNIHHTPVPHPLVRAFTMRDTWGLAREKLHFLQEAVDEVHNGYGNGPDRPSRADLQKLRRSLIKGVSPGLAFGLGMQSRTGIPQGLIPCAHGGTSMAQWSPDLLHKGGASLYGAMIRRCRKLGQPVAGVLWYQGESDANVDHTVSNYTKNMQKLVAAVRKDLRQPRLPWVVVQLGCHACVEGAGYWNRIQEQQRNLPNAIPRLDVVPSIDLELDDGIHIGGEGQQVLGNRLVRAAARLVHRDRSAKPGIALRQVNLVPTPWCGPGAFSVELSYANVEGALQSGSRPCGFSLVNTHGHDTHSIYRTSLHGRKILLHTALPRDQLQALIVSYGHGRYPVCNITDAGNMSVPGMRVPLKGIGVRKS